MSTAGQLSVQKIKGKFEQLQEVSNENNFKNFSKYSPSKRRESPTTTRDAFLHRDSLPSSEEEQTDELSNGVQSSSRFRSLSVGNASLSMHNSRNENVEMPLKKLSRNESFNHCKRNKNENIYYLNSALKFSNNNNNNNNNNNFSSFSEKQRLVESIVMNIRNNAVNSKRKDEEGKSRDFKAKDMFNITSKLEKDLKNVLERGSRIKWNAKSSNKTNFDSQEKKRCTKNEQILNNQSGANRKLFIKRNDKNNSSIDLYPIRACVSDDGHLTDDHNDRQPFKCESSPDLLKKVNRMESSLNGSSHDKVNCSLETNVQPSHCKEKNNRKSFSYLPPSEEIIEDKSSYTCNSVSPVRPPRKGIKKKKRAPLPPSPKFNFRDESTHKFSKNEEVWQSSLSPDDKCTDLSKDFNYEEQCERSLEGERFLYDKENTDAYVNISFNTSPVTEKRNEQHPFKWMSVSDSSLDVNTNKLPEGEAPQKPPRTFAHDIYHSLKQEKSDELSYVSTPRLTTEEIESLYTKPLKRLKDRPASSLHSKENTESVVKKPIIAPKPTDLLTKAKKRFSVVENMSTTADSLEKKPMRRNSSFRFSFKKSKNVVSPFKQVNLKKETRIGRKIKMVARNLSPKRNDSEKKVRFQSDCNSNGTSNNVDGGPIYATPKTNKKMSKEKPTELHYMCSLLFQETGNVGERYKENCPPLPPPNRDERSGIMEGLREELRQSCRLVQKRLKGTHTDRPNAREDC